MEDTTIERLRGLVLSEDGSLGDARRSELAAAALSRAVTDFIAMAGHRDGSHESAHRLYAEVGKASIHPHAADEVVWHVISQSAAEFKLKAAEATAICGGISHYMQHVRAVIRASAVAQPLISMTPREQLIRALCGGQHYDGDLDCLARAAGWPLPEEATLIAVEQTAAPGGVWQVPRAMLACSIEGFEVLVAAKRDTEMAVQFVRRSAPHATLAVCAGIAPSNMSNAVRWAVGLKRLEADGRVVARNNIIALADHAHALALHADARLGTWIAARTLAPLMEVARHERLELAETLLYRLTVTEATTGVADGLQVHAQTVRNRNRKLKEFFADRLADPDGRLELILALKSVLPDWRRDVELNRRRRRV